jgi:hypothetical protein
MQYCCSVDINTVSRSAGLLLPSLTLQMVIGVFQLDSLDSPGNRRALCGSRPGPRNSFLTCSFRRVKSATDRECIIGRPLCRGCRHFDIERVFLPLTLFSTSHSKAPLICCSYATPHETRDDLSLFKLQTRDLVQNHRASCR